jgi:hypothetical protein
MEREKILTLMDTLKESVPLFKSKLATIKSIQDKTVRIIDRNSFFLNMNNYKLRLDGYLQEISFLEDVHDDHIWDLKEIEKSLERVERCIQNYSSSKIKFNAIVHRIEKVTNGGLDALCTQIDELLTTAEDWNEIAVDLDQDIRDLCKMV